MPVTAAMDHYVRTRQIALARSIQARKKIYLDTRFWILVRNVVQEERVSLGERDLLALLRQGVADGIFVCPVSDSTFVEVMEQTYSPTRRIATAALIDELSLGVSLTRGDSRAATEIAHFFYRAQGQTNLYEMQQLVWTRLSYALGYLHPTVAGLDANIELEMQQEIFDLLWERSLSDMVSTIGEAIPRKEKGLDGAAATIDADIKFYQASLKSYQQTYRDEVVGAADNCCDFVVEFLALQAERAGHAPPAKDSPDWRALKLTSRDILVAAFTKPETRRSLRYMHIHAAMHAALRWNKGTKFTSNHLFDFEHASAALAYCDAFFTEGFIANTANARHTNLVELNGCQTTSSVDEAVQILKAFQAQT